jgi:hypothetical protein
VCEHGVGSDLEQRHLGRVHHLNTHTQTYSAQSVDHHKAMNSESSGGVGMVYV